MKKIQHPVWESSEQTMIGKRGSESAGQTMDGKQWRIADRERYAGYKAS